MSENTELYKDLAAACAARSETYQLLSRLFRKEVDQELLTELSGKEYPYGTGNSKVDAGYLKIATFLSNTWPNTITDLAVDFVRTFIGHGNDSYACAYPFESVYTSRERLLMMGARTEVLAIYRSQGLDKSDDWNEGEDHVSLELEFMATMAQRSTDALLAGEVERGDELLSVQRNFLADHLASWVPMFTADMKRFAKTDLYQGLALLTEGYLEIDAAFLKELTEDAAA